MYQYFPPRVFYPAGEDRLFSRYRYPVGVTVLRQQDGTWLTREVPSDDEVKAAARVFQGGRVYLVDDAEAAELTAAGLGDGLVPV